MRRAHHVRGIRQRGERLRADLRGAAAEPAVGRPEVRWDFDVSDGHADGRARVQGARAVLPVNRMRKWHAPTETDTRSRTSATSARATASAKSEVSSA